MKQNKHGRLKTIGITLLLILCLLFTGCLFGGDEGTQSPEGSGTTTENATKEQATQEQTTEAPAGPITQEMVAADLTEAIAALTGQEGVENAHLLGENGEPMEDFSYEGGTAIVAQHVRIETKSVTGEGDHAQAVLSITSPDLYPLIGEAVKDMDAVDEEKMTENLTALLQAGGYAEKTYEVTVELKSIDGIWYIEQNEEFQNALAGGLYEVEKGFAPKEGGNGQ